MKMNKREVRFSVSLIYIFPKKKKYKQQNTLTEDQNQKTRKKRVWWMRRQIRCSGF